MKDFFRWVFTGSNGIRAGWRVSIFVVIVAAIGAVINGAAYVAEHRFHVPLPKGGNELYPWVGIVELISVLMVLFAAWVMSKIEKRSMGVYGLPLRGALRSRVWLGMLWGFAGISAVLLAMYGMGGFHVAGISTGGLGVVVAGALYVLTFLCVGLFEEFAFRGYVLYTLTTGMGFWAAATILSLLFGAAHMGNPGETPMGILTCVMFAFFLCLTLRQTGNLWLAVGIHAGWDWGESFFYGVPDSGTTTWHPFLTPAFHGAEWLTGGKAGPEGSILTVVALIVMSAIVLWRYPRPHYDTRPALVPVAAGS
ncbi:MAG: CPBP family intramembrane metalloprotease [Candidatus Eremiobacteraeota bacterium]|nr:CPBP family intramembrane metalloprotease [Candidatus Eremiobacteraeota bacterium]